MTRTEEFDLYNKLSVQTSKIITKAYSTSFSLGIRLFATELRDPIYSIYGFVRLADEIVDTWHSLDQKKELSRLRSDCRQAVDSGFSANPILQSYAQVIRAYDIDYELVEAFLYSMELDLTQKEYTQEEYERYIYGSAEVVGLMCLAVFCKNDESQYARLLPGARSLGAAFQKVNFLRDFGEDADGLGRIYFPGVNMENFGETQKSQLVSEIHYDFEKALPAIHDLPDSARTGVRLAYNYYL
jgi:phytoene synthase